MTNRAIWSIWSVFASAFEAQAREVSLEYRRFSLPSFLSFIVSNADSSEVIASPLSLSDVQRAQDNEEISDDTPLADLVDSSQDPPAHSDEINNCRPQENQNRSDGSEGTGYSQESPRAQSDISADSLAEFIVVDSDFDETPLGDLLEPPNTSSELIETDSNNDAQISMHVNSFLVNGGGGPPRTSSDCTDEVIPRPLPD